MGVNILHLNYYPDLLCKVNNMDFLVKNQQCLEQSILQAFIQKYIVAAKVWGTNKYQLTTISK